MRQSSTPRPELLPPGIDAVIYEGIGSLPHFNPDLDHDPLPPEVAELRRLVEESTALLFSTPEYVGVMPGALKNLLEWTVGGVETTQKPTGWINPSAILNHSAGTMVSCGPCSAGRHGAGRRR